MGAADELKRLIEASGRSRYDIAQASGVTQGQLSRFVNGLVGMNPESMEKVADALGYRLTFVKKSNRRKGR
ncbi:MAG: helix-turn-helix transcriptional regulator [Phycisphaeraceae bacterium]|nr:helix-turn-helix transcriptional regulator [Phycisphaeraceae bacterium]